MKIGVLAPFEESIPPRKYGGTELVVYNLVEELVKRGHQVTLIASGDAETSAKLVPVFRSPLRKRLSKRSNFVRENFRHIGVGFVVKYLLDNQGEFDLIHNHLGWRFLPFCCLLECPVLTTMHGPLTAPYQRVMLKKHKKQNFVSISLNQRRGLPELNFVSNVYNGIDIEKFSYSSSVKDYYLFLGRIAPNKGPVEAVKIAKKANINLIVAAKVDPVDKNYFKKEFEPLIDGKQIKFVGEVDHKEKVRLLKNAKGLIAPIQWEEPFGLVFVEAMACGTPVITMNRGSVPEIILHEKTGFICNSLDEAVHYTKKISNIDRKLCHFHVKNNFTSATMVDNYVKTYEKLIENNVENVAVKVAGIKKTVH